MANTRLNQNELVNGRPCHDQTLDELLDGIYYRVFVRYYSCTADDFFDIGSTYTDNCRSGAIRRGLDRCQWGVSSQSQGRSIDSSVSLEFSTLKWKLGGSVSHKSTLTIDRPFGMGSNQACMGFGTKATDQCTADLSTCTAEAEEGERNTPLSGTLGELSGMAGETLQADAGHSSSGTTGTSPESRPGQPTAPDFVLEMAPESRNEHLLAQIDRTRLGLVDDGRPVVNRLYRPLARHPLEMPSLHTERLRFLARWSRFLERNAISDDAMTAMQDVMRREQHGVQAEYETEAGIVEAVFRVDMRTGEVGTDFLRDYLALYRERDGLQRRVVLGQSRVQEAAKEIFGAAQGAEFFDTVWRGMLNFGFSAPFAVTRPGATLEE